MSVTTISKADTALDIFGYIIGIITEIFPHKTYTYTTHHLFPFTLFSCETPNSLFFSSRCSFSNLPAHGPDVQMFLHVAIPARFQEKGRVKGRGIFDFTPRETSFINSGGRTTVKKVAWLAGPGENVDGIPNNMILMSWKIPGPPEDCPDATVMRNATVLLNSGSPPFL